VDCSASVNVCWFSRLAVGAINSAGQKNIGPRIVLGWRTTCITGYARRIFSRSCRFSSSKLFVRHFPVLHFPSSYAAIASVESITRASTVVISCIGLWCVAIVTRAVWRRSTRSLLGRKSVLSSCSLPVRCTRCRTLLRQPWRHLRSRPPGPPHPASIRQWRCWRCRLNAPRRQTADNKAVVTSTNRLRFDCSSTALRQLDDLRYDRRPLTLAGCCTEA